MQHEDLDVVGRALQPLTRSSLRLAVVVGAIALATVPPGVVAAVPAPTAGPEVAAAREALRRMSLVDRVGQLVMTRVPGTELDRDTTTALRAMRLGGVIVFRDNYRSRAQLARLTRSIQAATLSGDPTRPRALVTVDQEGGVVKRIPDAPPWRSHPRLGAANRLAATRAEARATGAALAAVGVHMDLAPVADLDLGPRHVMRARAFGVMPARVAAHVAAFVDGLQAGGAAAAVKHFPGFGSASVNSDDALAVITRTRAQLEADLVPFRRAMLAGAEAVMVSHAVYSRIDRRRPASASPATYRLLRDDLGYRGVAITDSLHALGFGAATRGSVADGCVATIAAGADIALLTGSLRDAAACRRSLVAAARSGTLGRDRVDEAALRVLTLKARLGLLGATTARAAVSRPEPAG